MKIKEKAEYKSIPYSSKMQNQNENVGLEVPYPKRG